VRRLLALIAVLTTVLAVAPADGKTSKPCARKGSHTVTANQQARVYELANKSGGSNLYGCLRSNDRRQLLASGYDDNYTSSGTYDRVKLKGHVVSWRFTSVDDSCKAACPPGYNPTSTHRYSRNLKTRKTAAVSRR
jgi:hypothetical protein